MSRKDKDDRSPILAWLKILGFLPPLVTVTYKGWIPVWLAVVAMAILVVGLVFGMKKIVAGVVLPIFGAAIFAVLYSDGDSGKFAEILTVLGALALALLGFWFVLGGPLRRKRH